MFIECKVVLKIVTCMCIYIYINAPSHLLSGTKYYITFIWYHITKPKASYTKCCTYYIITYYSKMNQAFTIEQRNVIVLDDTIAPPLGAVTECCDDYSRLNR
jgi:hypothetical protein